MKELITVTPSAIGQATIQTCNARDLHAFLEVQHNFRDWIRNRIAEFDFVAGQDYVEVSLKNERNPQGGRPAKEYAISLDMAKELSMVERTDKGKQARQYFIECERRLQAGQPPVLPPLKQTAEAAKAFSTVFRTMRLIGLDRNAAAISANQTIRKVAGTDLLALSGNTCLLAENQSALYLTPTELGKRLGGLSGRDVNLLLADAGLQAKTDNRWEPLPAGQQYARLLDVGKCRSNGTPVTQLKWATTVLPLLESAAA